MANIKVPPHNDEAEASLLGAILIDRDAVIEVVEYLKPEFFYKESHGAIYAAMVSLYEHQEPIDIITLKTQLKKQKTYEKIGGTSYLTSLIDAAPTSANATQYARIIQDLYLKRQLVALGARLTERAMDEATEVKTALDLSESDIFSLSQAHIRRDFVPLKNILAESFDRLDDLHKRGSSYRGIPTGFTDLDRKLAGLQASNLVILAARPGQGKTAFVLNVAQHVAVTNKSSVGFFSLEMSKEELVDRLLVSQADVDAWRLKTGRLSDDDFNKLSTAMGELAEAQLFIDDTPGLNIMELRTKARRLSAEHQLSLIIVDYLQLVDPGRRFDSRVQEVSLVSAALKNLARELRVPVLALSQLSRAVEARGTKVPQLADLRESGAIEQDADVVMFIYRPEQEFEGLEDQINSKILIAKHRNGPTGEIDLVFRGDRIRFYSVEHKRDATAAISESYPAVI